MRVADLLNARVAAVIVALAAIAVYLNSLANGFALDDVWIIEQNTRVHQLADLRRILLTPYWPFAGSELGLYRPVAILGYALQWNLAGGAPWVFHATSIVLHAGVSLLLYLLLRPLAGTAGALAGGLLFAVHPLHTEAVANVVGQAELIAAAALLAICVLHVHRPQGMAVPRRRLVAYLVLFTIAVGAKESAVVLPALLLALDLAQRRLQVQWGSVRRYVGAMSFPVLMLGATLALYLIFRFEALDGRLLGADANPAYPFLREEYRVLNAFRAFPEFARLLFFPADLSADYSPAAILPVESFNAMTLLGLALLAGVVGLALVLPWNAAIGLPAAWFMITIITVSNLLFPIGVLVAERTLYLPSAALAIGAAFAVRSLPGLSGARRWAYPLLAATVLVLLAGKTWLRNPAWASTLAIYTEVTRDFPESYRGQWAIGSLYAGMGMPENAELHYGLAERLYGRDPQMLEEFAGFLLQRGKVDRGVELLERAWRHAPTNANTAINLAFGYLTADRLDEALAVARDAERLGVAPARSLPVRARIYEKLGRHGDAVGVWRAYGQVSTEPVWTTRARTARALARWGDPSAASVQLDSAAASAAGDSAALAVVAAVRRNLANGCYDVSGARDCPEPLRDGVVAIAHRTLQNATPAVVP